MKLRPTWEGFPWRIALVNGERHWIRGWRVLGVLWWVLGPKLP